MRTLAVCALGGLLLFVGSSFGQPVPDSAGDKPVSTSARQSSTAPDAPMSDPSHVLSSSRDGGILYAPTQNDNPAFRAAVSLAAGGVNVDYFNPRVDTPSLDLLDGYDCVFTWTNYAYDDRHQFGDRLASYVDAGGKLILGQWSYSGFGGGLAVPPPIVTQGYCPVTVLYTSFTSESYAGDGEACLHAGIGSYASGYRDYCTVHPDCGQDGSFSDGSLTVAYRPDFRVIYSAGNTGWDFGSGEWPELIANMCCCPEDGDFDADSDVDLEDFAGWEGCATGPLLGPYPLECALLDFEFDGDVDLEDYAAFQRTIGGQ